MSVLLPEHRERTIGSGQDYLRTQGGVFVPPWADVEIEESTAAPLGIDLFAGAGGFSCGFHQAGWHVIAATEWWPVAVETYLCNLGSPDTLVYVGETAAPDATKKERAIFDAHGGEFITAAEFFELLPVPKAQQGLERFGPGRQGWIADEDRSHACEAFFCCDVRELTGDFILDTLGLEQADIGCVFGGPPCQGFSVAGKQDVADPRNQLVFEFARLVCEISPAAMCMENVPGIVNMVTPEGVPVLDALALILERGGMGEHDALKRSLMSTAGLGAAVKGATKRGRKPAADIEEADDEDEAQLALEVV